MIYLVTRQQQLFENSLWTYLPPEDSLKMVKSWDRIQIDTETLGRDAHLVSVLTLQMGNKAANAQIVVDATTIDITIYKEVLESKLCIGHNLKFDIQFLFKHGIILTKVFDTMIVEQLLHLGYNNKYFRYSLHDTALRYLGIELDKSVRGEIIWRGLDDRTVVYAANDVVHLEDLMELEIEACKKASCLVAMKLENAFVPVLAYLEWCGIRLDQKKWLDKMAHDKERMDIAIDSINDWIRTKAETDSFFKRFLDPQMDLFDLKRKVSINWESPKQVIPIFQYLGFDTKVKDPDTGEIKDSIQEKVIITQKGIEDTFLKLYLEYQGAAIVVKTFGKSYINSVNPYTGRIHTNFKQLGAASGRMACGNKQENVDLSRVVHHSAGYPQLQNLPADKVTRGCFVPNPGNLMTSCDYSALESRLGADIYQDQAMIDEFLYGSGKTIIILPLIIEI